MGGTVVTADTAVTAGLLAVVKLAVAVIVCVLFPCDCIRFFSAG
jgi:hypothetical protein